MGALTPRCSSAPPWWSIANPPDTDFFVPSGVHFAIQSVRGGFLLSDGHHNRVLFVSTRGVISEAKTFGNVVPTGLEVSGRTVFVSETGPVPHTPEDGKVVAFRLGSSSPDVRTVASGYSLLVDVELDRCGRLFALSQGDADVTAPEGAPGLPVVTLNGEVLKISNVSGKWDCRKSGHHGR